MKRAERQRGVALLWALLGLLVASLLAFALASRGAAALTLAGAEVEASEALYLADSGLAHATALLARAGPRWDPVLQNGGTPPCSGDELASVLGSWPAADLIPAGGRPLPPAGTYQVRVCDDDGAEAADPDPAHDSNGRILVRATGWARRGASATIEAVLERTPSGLARRGWRECRGADPDDPCGKP